MLSWLANTVLPTGPCAAVSTAVIRLLSVVNRSTLVLAFTVKVSPLAGVPFIETSAPKSNAAGWVSGGACLVNWIAAPSV
jgi:hypothetical protein